MSSTFIHLHLHTEYSLSDGIVRIGPLVEAVVGAGMPAVAVTDQCNLFALVKFYKAAVAAGVKPVAGSDLWLRDPTDERSFHRLVLLVQDGAGYRNLSHLLSRAWRSGQVRGQPTLDPAWLQGRTEGLIALSGGREGDVGRALLGGHRNQARQRAQRWMALFDGRFYLEVSRTGREGEESCVRASARLGAELGCPIVATNDVRFLQKEDFETHEARVCIHSGRTLDDPRRPRPYSDQQYLRSPQEMAEVFRDLPGAVANSVEIAKRCNLGLEFDRYHLPAFPTPAGRSVEEHLKVEAREGLAERLQDHGVAEGFSEPDYRQRLDEELEVILQMGFPGYFLIVADFIRWARDNDIPVGPGRGSGAGSLVAYSLGITSLDPLRYGLLFERFLNPERVSMPDFDVDFCMEKRDRVIDYVAERYGREKVCQIITFGSMAARAVVRDAGRVLGHPYGFVDRIAKLIPMQIGITLDDALADREGELHEIYRQDEEVREVIDLARSLEGLARNPGRHAGGVVIAPVDLERFMPLFYESNGGAPVTQFDKDDVEAIGLVKFDFLGLRTLTIIDWAVAGVDENRGASGEAPLDIDAIPLDDAKTFELLRECRTTAVFQLESRGMKDLIRRLQPDSFEEIVALVALFRPGPLQSGMVDDFIDRKHGRARVDYPHPSLESILKPTYGVILYQEQVMQIAQVLSGYTLGGADLLRRAMGKKKPEEMARQRETFVEGAVSRGVERRLASDIFDLIEKFAGYGFNKCLHGDTEIVDADSGAIHRVADLFRRRRTLIGRLKVHSLDADYKLKARTVEDIVWNGVKQVYRLTTRSGRQIVATGNHPLRVFDGWKILEELQVGEALATPRRLFVESRLRWKEHELIALAGLLSEGNTCHPSALYFYNNDNEALVDFAAAVGGFENTQARLTRRDDGRGEVCAVRTRKYPWNHPEFEQKRHSGMRQWAERLEILGTKAAAKCVPPELFELSDDCIALFLGRLWSGDGSLSPTHAPPYYATSSYRLARDVQYLLLRLGIYTTLKKKRFAYREATRDGYTVHLCGEGMLERFRRQICPHVVGRQRDLQVLDSYLVENAGLRSSRDTVPADIRKWVDEERRALGLTWKQLEARTRLSMREFYGSGSAGKKGFRRHTVSRLAEVLASVRLAQLSESDIFWDEIVDIEPAGTADTYDLTVEGCHNFVADGLIVHNSHSAAYALIAYQTAWLKAHYPADYMAAVLSADMDHTDKVVVMIDEARRMGLTVHGPDVNSSQWVFRARDGAAIDYGLGAIKGVGQSAVESIVAAREEGGPFRGLNDFCQRVELNRVNRRVMEALILAGALDALGPNRASLMAALPGALHAAEQLSRDRSAGQSDIFGLDTTAQEGAVVPEITEWDDERRLRGERETLGLYFTGHPIDRYEEELGRFVTCRLGELADHVQANGSVEEGRRRGGTPVVLAGLITGIRKRAGRMAFVTLDDKTGRAELALFDETFRRFSELLTVDRVVVVDGSASVDDFSGGFRVTVNELWEIEQARGELARGLEIQLNGAGMEGIERLCRALEPHRCGRAPVWVDYQGERARARLRLGDEWRVRVCGELLESLKEIAGVGGTRIIY